MTPRRILVTGGAGFLGSHLCDRLVGAGHRVFCLDDFSTGRRANIAALRDHPAFALIEHDVTRPLPPLAVDAILNLACPASPPQYRRDPLQTLKTSVYGTVNLIALARATGAPILQASTSEVYGDPVEHPQTEAYWGNVNPIGPRSCYDEGKRCAETLLFDQHRLTGLPIKVARIFNTYGPRMDVEDGRVVSNFITQALRGRPITIHGDGSQTRSFCYVDDLVEGLVRLMEAPAAVTGPVNLGNPEEATVLALAELVVALTGSRSPIHWKPPIENDPARRRPDIALARDRLDWQPRTPLRQGLLQTIAWFDALLGAPPRARHAPRPG